MNKLNLLFRKLEKYNFKEIKKESIKIKKKDCKSIKLIETDFIDDIIRKYIKENLKYKYEIKYKYKNKLIRLCYYSKKEKLNNILIKKILKRIIFMMDIVNKYININIDIYDTPFKKELPCTNCNKELKKINVNSGLSYNNNIIIYRKEEVLKLLIHEMIHVLDIDVKYENMYDKINLLDKLCLNDLLINESYVETWAILLDTYLKIKENMKISESIFINKVNEDKIFNIKQSSKILIYLKKNINGKCIIKKNDDVNITSYFILKTYNLFYLEDFLKLFMDKKNIIVNNYNYKEYIKYLLEKIKKNIFKDMKRNIKKKKYNLSLKMSLNN